MTLILDDADGKEDAMIWDICYHVFFDQACHERLLQQATKLHGLAASLDTWRAGEYGKLIRFCDRGTLSRVAGIWAFYMSAASAEKRTWMRERFRAICEIRKKVKRLSDSTIVLSGMRSATPVSLKAMDDLNELYRHFWRHGSTHLDQAVLFGAKYPNPTVFSPDPSVAMHYATDPLLGFHLAIAYIPLTAESPLYQARGRAGGKPSLDDVVAAARAEFWAWCRSFRRHAAGAERGMLTLRFFAGEATAFAHTLQNRRTTGSATTASWYRSRNLTMEPLALVEDDYGGDGPAAPVSFDVIDTSNLLDHVGALNLLVACSPLLKPDAASALHTETMVGRGLGSPQELLDELLCGHFPTVSLLLGLFPVEYWTDTSPTSTGDERLLDNFLSSHNMEESKQLFSRITWKRPPCGSCARIEPLRMREAELASLLYRIYLNMFPGEDLARLWPSIKFELTSGMATVSLPTYTRLGFISFLRLVRSRVVADWDKTMNILLELIENDGTLLTGRNFLQEMYLYLHHFNVYTVNALKHCPKTMAKELSAALQDPARTGGLLGWENMPPSLCVTLKIPRPALKVLVETNPEERGTIPLECIIESSSGTLTPLGRWQNTFASVQVCFGKLTTSGARFGNGFKTYVSEDPEGWHGHSPLLASFMVPSWVLLLEPRSAAVALCLKSTPYTASKFARRLNLQLSLFRTTLSDVDHVYISKDLPNKAGRAAVPGFAKDDIAPPGTEESGVKTAMSAATDPTGTRIVSLTARLDILSDALRSALSGGCSVQTVVPSPCVVTVTLNTTPFRVVFPLPVVTTTLKTRIARRSSYIEIVAQAVTDPSEQVSAALTAPTILARPAPDIPPTPVPWTMPRVNLRTLPVIDAGAITDPDWLGVHLRQMFTAYDVLMQSTPSTSTSNSSSTSPSMVARNAVRELLQTAFTELASHQNNRPRPIFSFPVNTTNPGDSVPLTMAIIPSTLRLDPSSRTVLLDSALLPMTTTVVGALESAGFFAALRARKVESLVSRLPPSTTQEVDNVAAAATWRALVRAWTERCREWAHRPDCRYYRVGPGQGEEGWAAATASVGIDEMTNVVCGCGTGVFPAAGFEVDVPMWETVKGFCVRAAISPLFPGGLSDEAVLAHTLRRLVSGTSEDGAGVEAARRGERSGCHACGSEQSKNGGDLKHCAKCAKARYCGRACQRADWKRHKPECTSKK